MCVGVRLCVVCVFVVFMVINDDGLVVFCYECWNLIFLIVVMVELVMY